ncbi:MAG: HAMP domain-containing sensor histidine kinase [bacterium]
MESVDTLAPRESPTRAQYNNESRMIMDAQGSGEMDSGAYGLRTVTTALLRASGVAEVAAAVIQHGLPAVHATHGCLLLLDDTHNLKMVACTSAGFSGVPVDETVLDRRLPLRQGAEMVGELLLRGNRNRTPEGLDDVGAVLLAHMAAHALVRAQAYDAALAARQKVEALLRVREEVLGAVAHDLRNPLNLVGTSAQLLAEDGLTAARRERLVAINVSAVHRMDRLIGDLLDVVRLEAGPLSVDLQPCELEGILTVAVEALQSRADERGVALELVRPPSGAKVYVDAGRIHQVMDNLIGNAVKFTPAAGRVRVMAEVDGAMARVSVSDTGPGIPEEQGSRLFERFWQARGGDRRGLGLGLAIAKGIVDAHGGRIWVESTVGKGSQFLFSVPLA